MHPVLQWNRESPRRAVDFCHGGNAAVGDVQTSATSSRPRDRSTRGSRGSTTPRMPRSPAPAVRAAASAVVFATSPLTRGSPRTPSASSRHTPRDAGSLEIADAAPRTSRRLSRPLDALDEHLAGADAERTSYCSKEEFWSIFDVFASMDRLGCGVISRADYCWALKELGTSINFQKFSRRVKLDAYFRQSSQDLSLPALLRRTFPLATLLEIRCMLRWAHYRRAQRLVSQVLHSEEAPKREHRDTQLREAFSMLAEDGDEEVLLGTMVSAQFITRLQASQLPESTPDSGLCFQRFCEVLYRSAGQSVPLQLEEVEGSVEGDGLTPTHATHALLAAIEGHIQGKLEVDAAKPTHGGPLPGRELSTLKHVKDFEVDALDHHVVEGKSPPCTPSTCASSSMRQSSIEAEAWCRIVVPLPPEASPRYRRPRV